MSGIHNAARFVHVMMHVPLDYESRKLYSFKVTASDPHMDARFLQSGSHSDTAVVKLSVMDVEEAPIFSSSEYSMETREGAAGNAIGTVNAHDPDMGHSPI
ncbi:cadherin-12a, partial [Tachysurus ichikawai]